MHSKAFLKRWPENKTVRETSQVRSTPVRSHSKELEQHVQSHPVVPWGWECRRSWHMMKWGRQARWEDQQAGQWGPEDAVILGVKEEKIIQWSGPIALMS